MPRLPWMQFYPADWTRDTAALTLSARGAWVTIVCAMWGAKERGRLSMPSAAWGRMLGVPAMAASKVIEELVARGVCERVTECNGDVTLLSRRMVRDESARESTRYRVKEYRVTHMKRPCNDSVTPQKAEGIYQKAEGGVGEEAAAAPATMPLEISEGAALTEIVDAVIRCRPEFKAMNRMAVENALRVDGLPVEIVRKAAGEFSMKMAGRLELPPDPVSYLRGFLRRAAPKPVVRQSSSVQSSRALHECVAAVELARNTAIAPGDVDRAIAGLRDKYCAAMVAEAVGICQHREALKKQS